MSPITALVKSDFIKLLGLRRSMIPFVIVMICFSLSPQFLSAGMIMLIYGSVFTMLAYDQSSSSWHWYGSLPVTRRQIFLGKYCFSLLLLLASIPFMILFCGLSGLISGKFEPMVMLNSLLLGGTTSCLFLAIMLPIPLIMGTVKSRYFMMILYFVAFFGTTTLAQNDVFGHLPRLLESGFAGGQLLLWLAPAAGLVLMGLSCLAFAPVYCRREYVDEI